MMFQLVKVSWLFNFKTNLAIATNPLMLICVSLQNFFVSKLLPQFSQLTWKVVEGEIIWPSNWEILLSHELSLVKSWNGAVGWYLPWWRRTEWYGVTIFHQPELIVKNFNKSMTLRHSDKHSDWVTDRTRPWEVCASKNLNVALLSQAQNA